ncbi:long-chain fatty acid--CoA ligase [Streptomyces sp. NPDC048109]|uniref:long-chain-fatty-acid--CoA ligase n=1 Tax=Streptomyces TaxID=1883 RepID=UPI00343166CB
MSFNLATMLFEARAAHPDKPLCLGAHGSHSYADVDDRSARIAAALLGQGLRPGDRVAVQLPNIPEFVSTYLAVLRAGLVMVPLNPMLRAPEIAYHLADSGASVLVTAGDCLPDVLEARGSAAVFAVGDGGLSDGVRPFTDLLTVPGGGEIAATSADDTAVLLYTSGTTGHPKGAELTHFQLYMNCTVGGELFGFGDTDVGLAVLPLFHVFGLSSVLNVAIRFGGSVCLVPRFETRTVLDAVERHRCTVFAGVPTMYAALLQADITGRDLSSLRVGVSGGAAMPGEVLRAFEGKFSGVVVLEGYGLSETASSTTFNISAEQRRVGSIGRPIWGVTARIVDDTGGPLEPGPDQVGEIVVRGHNVMKGYWRRPEETAAALRGGWLHTGDLGYSDEDGYLYVVDRKKDLVIRGGYNVYPREVEELLHAHLDVTGAAVLGRPDPRLGEEVVACVTLRPGASAGEAELIAFCRESLAPYKCPREVRVLDDMPVGPTGKILKRELRSWLS